jgi:hypothetical protein
MNHLKTRSGRCIKYNNIELVEKNILKKNEKIIIDKIKKILEIKKNDRTKDESDYLIANNDIVKKLDDLKKINLNKILHNEIFIDDETSFESKCKQLANAIYISKNLVIFINFLEKKNKKKN